MCWRRCKQQDTPLKAESDTTLNYGGTTTENLLKTPNNMEIQMSLTQTSRVLGTRTNSDPADFCTKTIIYTLFNFFSR